MANRLAESARIYTAFGQFLHTLCLEKKKNLDECNKKNELKILITEPWQSSLMKRETGRQAYISP